MQSHLTRNPAHQNAMAGVVPQMAGTHVTALEAGVTALNNAKCAQRAQRDARDASHETLAGHLAASRREVGLALTADDPRWLDFRRSVPADVRSPEAVSVIDARPGLPGHVSLHWIDSLRATRYAIEAAVGTSTEFAHVTVVQDTVADLTFAPGAPVRLRVRARNGAGESGPSPVVTITAPQTAAA